MDKDLKGALKSAWFLMVLPALIVDAIGSVLETPEKPPKPPAPSTPHGQPGSAPPEPMPAWLAVYRTALLVALAIAIVLSGARAGFW
jgi:hypothetical protein